MMREIWCDWHYNSKRIAIMLVLFRAAQEAAGMPRGGPLSRFLSALYSLYAAMFVGAELPVATQVGRPVRVVHGSGLVVHKNAVLGRHVTLRNGVTIGVSASGSSKAPIVEDHVDIGSGAMVIGDVTVGKSAVVGAMTLVRADVPSGRTVVGIPGRVLE